MWWEPWNIGSIFIHKHLYVTNKWIALPHHFCLRFKINLTGINPHQLRICRNEGQTSRSTLGIQLNQLNRQPSNHWFGEMRKVNRHLIEIELDSREVLRRLLQPLWSNWSVKISRVLGKLSTFHLEGLRTATVWDGVTQKKSFVVHLFSIVCNCWQFNC